MAFLKKLKKIAGKLAGTVAGTAFGPVGGAVIGAAGQFLAGKQQNKAAQQAIAAQQQGFDVASQLNQPFVQAGGATLARQMQLLGLGGPQGLGGPGQFGQQQGFDSSAYFGANPDVQQAMGGLGQDDWDYIQDQGYEASPQGFAQFHYDTSGQREGRPTGVPEPGPNGFPGAGQAQGGFNIPGQGQGTLTELIQSTPGYKFRFGEGIRAAESSAAHRGRLMSGSQLRRLQEFGGEFAAREFGDYWNRLAGVAGQGAQARGAITGAAGQQAAALPDIYKGQTGTGANLLGAISGGISAYRNRNQPAQTQPGPNTLGGGNSAINTAAPTYFG